jgi:proline iminopeptidase
VLRHPESVGALILCNTAATLGAELDPADPTLAERAGPEAVEVAGRVFAGDVSPQTGEAFGRLVAPYYAAPGHESIPGHLFPLSRQSPDVMSFFFSGPAADYDVQGRLREIAVPTLVVGGAYDWVCPPSASRTIAAKVPHAELVLLEHAGHFSFSEQPDLFHDAISDFVRGLERTWVRTPTHE